MPRALELLRESTNKKGSMGSSVRRKAPRKRFRVELFEKVVRSGKGNKRSNIERS